MTYLDHLTNNRDQIAAQIAAVPTAHELEWILAETEKEIRSAKGECCVACGNEPHHDGGHPIYMFDTRTGELNSTWCEFCYTEADTFHPFK